MMADAGKPVSMEDEKSPRPPLTTPAENKLGSTPLSIMNETITKLASTQCQDEVPLIQSVPPAVEARIQNSEVSHQSLRRKAMV